MEAPTSKPAAYTDEEKHLYKKRRKRRTKWLEQVTLGEDRLVIAIILLVIVLVGAWLGWLSR